jgi:hypothetical protein
MACCMRMIQSSIGYKASHFEGTMAIERGLMHTCAHPRPARSHQIPLAYTLHILSSSSPRASPLCYTALTLKPLEVRAPGGFCCEGGPVTEEDEATTGPCDSHVEPPPVLQKAYRPGSVAPDSTEDDYLFLPALVSINRLDLQLLCCDAIPCSRMQTMLSG